MSRRLVWSAALAVLAAPAIAQPPNYRPPIPLRGLGQPDAPPAGLQRSQVAAWAGQLALQVRAVRDEVAGLGLRERMTVGLAADQAARAADDFAQLARGPADAGQLARGHQGVDAALDRLEAAAAPWADRAPGVKAALARARYADERLHAALSGPAADGGGDAAVRLAEALDAQADVLRTMAGGPGVAGGTPELDQRLKAFSRRAGRLAGTIAGGGSAQDQQRDFGRVAADWQAVGPGLAAVAAGSPAVRDQAARVDGLVRDLARLLGAGPAPPAGPNPQPGFGLIAPRGEVFVVGAGDGGGPHVRVYDGKGQLRNEFFAYDPQFRGGVRVAVADLTGDGFPEIVTAPGKGMPPVVRVFDGRDLNLLTEFAAFDPPFDLGVTVAAHDLTADGKALVAVAAGAGGGPHVRVFDLAAGREEYALFAYDQAFRGGARVALGDVDGDGAPELVTAPGPGAPPVVRVFGGRDHKPAAEFLAFDDRWRGGVTVAATDVRRGGRAQVLAGTDEGGPAAVRVFDLLDRKSTGEIAPFGPAFRGGVRVAAFDANGDGVVDVLCAPARGAAPVRVFDGRTRERLGEFSPFGPTFEGGVFPASR